MLPIYLLAWIPMLALAVINGSFRQFVYGKLMSEPDARRLSTLTLILLLAVYIDGVVRLWPPVGVGQAALFGLMWAAMTFVFETGMGRMSGKSWAELTEAYRIWEGHLWALVPLWLIAAPPLFYVVHFG